MKKLMILAAVAAATVGAYATDCEPESKVTDEAWVYKWSFSGKTSVGVSKTVKGAGGVCTPGTPDTNCIRVKGSLSATGYSSICNPVCTDFTDMEYSGWKTTKPQKVDADAQNSVDTFNVIGTKKKDAEVEGILELTLPDLSSETFTLTYAGFGSYDLKNDRLSSASGNFAGTVDMTYYVKDGVCCPTVVWGCDYNYQAIADVNSIAYGKWSVKFDKKLSKKYAKGTWYPEY